MERGKMADRNSPKQQAFDPNVVYQELQMLQQHFQAETSRLIDYLTAVRPNVQDGLWDLTYLREAFVSYFDHEMWRCYALNPLEQPPWGGYMYYTSANIFQEYSRVLRNLQRQGLIQLVQQGQTLPTVLIPQPPTQPGQAIVPAQAPSLHPPMTQPLSGSETPVPHRGMT